MYSGLGLERKKVTLKTDYELWDKEYLHEKEILLKNAGRIIRKIEHVGSTSLHIKSKPILDIAVMIESKDDFEILRNIIEKLGYTYRENSGDDERRFFAFFRHASAEPQRLPPRVHKAFDPVPPRRNVEGHSSCRTALPGDRTHQFA